MIKCLSCNSCEVEIILASDYKDDIGHDYAECPNCGVIDISEVRIVFNKQGDLK